MFCASCGEATPTDPCATCGRGALLVGRYRLDGVLGRGAHATTWRATRVSDGQVVAIKEITAGHRTDRKASELFRREARVLGELDHPAIPRYLEDFEAALGRQRTLCLVQELVEGETLAQEASHRRYSPAEVAAIVEELGRVVAWLHERSPPVIHRDLKPENIVRRPDGTLALVDFGSVLDVVNGTLGGSTATGTFGYMAPEQLAGDATPASDVYGLGALAVALLTRRDPRTLLRGDGRLDWRRQVAVPSSFADAVDRMLSADATLRPSADEIFLPTVVLADRPPAPEIDVPELPAQTSPRNKLASTPRGRAFVWSLLAVPPLVVCAALCVMFATAVTGRSPHDQARDLFAGKSTLAWVTWSGPFSVELWGPNGQTSTPGRIPAGNYDVVTVTLAGARDWGGTLDVHEGAKVALVCPVEGGLCAISGSGGTLVYGTLKGPYPGEDLDP